MRLRFKPRSARLLALAWTLIALMALGPPAIANAAPIGNPSTVQPGNPASPSASFTNTSDPLIQQRELSEYVQAHGLSPRIAQVDLATMPKVSQYTDIDASEDGYGYNACGLVAAAAALGGDDWTPLVDRIAAAAGRSYSPYAGIQPSKYVAALQKVFGADKVVAMNSGTLGDLYRELSDGKVVIVDIQVNAFSESPSAAAPNYAHFARVLAVDDDQRQITIENTLSGGSYWTLSLSRFVRVWLYPETAVSLIPDPRHAEPVTRWMITLDRDSPAA